MILKVVNQVDLDYPLTAQIDGNASDGWRWSGGRYARLNWGALPKHVRPAVWAAYSCGDQVTFSMGNLRLRLASPDNLAGWIRVERTNG